MKTLNKIEETVFEYVKKNNMISPGDRVVLGISGGADSVCLFFLMLEYRKLVPFDLAVVHVNHGIREDAGDDAVYVERLCSEQGIPFQLVQADVRSYAESERISEEDAGRRVRYQAFSDLLNTWSGNKIAVAHNADDRAETMLMHLLRGSGLRGLRGIEAVRGNIIRPLLCLERKEIEQYLIDRGIQWQTDSTNLEDDYTRNRVRHHVIPEMQEVAPNCVQQMCRTADMLSETEEYLQQQTADALQSCIISVENDRVETEVAAVTAYPNILRRRMILDILEQLSPTGKDIGQIHVEDVLKLYAETGNRQVDLPFGIRVCRSYGRVIFSQGQNMVPDKRLPILSYDVYEDRNTFPDWRNLENKYTKWLSYDKMVECTDGAYPELRFRKTGDFIHLSDGKGGVIRKSIKDFMIDLKIPKEFRDSVPLLAAGDEIIWVIGYRINELYKITETTNRIVRIQLEN